MSPSTYLIAIPVGLIALSGWLVKKESDSFSTGRRTSGIQQVAQHSKSARGHVTANEVESPRRLDHERYGWIEAEAEAGRPLGSDAPHRPLGGRPQPSTDWLATQSPRGAPSKSVALPPIPGYLESPTLQAPFFETVPADSGFHIAADEATKVDMENQTVTFNGHVKLASPQFHLKASKLVVHLGKDKKSFHLLEATGAVDVQLTGVPDEKKYRGQSGAAIYDTTKGTLTLTGWPKIQGSGQELIAADENTRIVLVPKTGKLVTQGRTQTRIAKRLMEESSARQ